MSEEILEHVLRQGKLQGLVKSEWLENRLLILIVSKARNRATDLDRCKVQKGRNRSG